MLQLETARPAYAPRPPRTAGIALITVLHTAAIFAFATALEFGPGIKITTPFEVKPFIEENRDTPPPPPENPVKRFEPPTVVVPDVIITLEPEPSETVVFLPPPERIVQPPQPPPVTLTPARPVVGTHTTPEYPILSRRMAEEGAVRLALTIDADGMVSVATVQQSSGFRRLDEAAVDWVKRYWRYRPAMRGVMPVESTREVILQFKLTEAGR